MENNKSPKEQFFSKISHDLRGSFTSILGFSDILNDPTEDLTNEEISEFVKRIGIQTKESFDLLVNFINWLKLDSYSSGLTKESIDLSEIILNIQSLKRNIISEKNVKIFNHCNNNIHVSMDFEILHSIFNNTFSYLIDIIAEDSSIEIHSTKADDNLIGVKFVAQIGDQNLTYLNNIEETNSDIPFSLLFASKISKLSGGLYDVSLSENKELVISIFLPMPMDS